MAYDHVIRSYLAEVFTGPNLIGDTELKHRGVIVRKGEFMLRFFSHDYLISPHGIQDIKGTEAPASVSVVLLKYLLHRGPAQALQDQWLNFRDFKDSTPFVGAFQNNVLTRMERYFHNDLDSLRNSSLIVGGTLKNLTGYDLACDFLALPQVPLRLLYNAGDEILPSKAILLFKSNAGYYLDIECLAAVGWLLCDLLIKASGRDTNFLIGTM